MVFFRTNDGIADGMAGIADDMDLGAGAQGEGAKNYRYRLVAASELI